MNLQRINQLIEYFQSAKKTIEVVLVVEKDEKRKQTAKDGISVFEDTIVVLKSYLKENFDNLQESQTD